MPRPCFRPPAPRDVVLGASLLDGVLLACLSQLEAGELAHRLVQSIAGRTLARPPSSPATCRPATTARPGHAPPARRRRCTTDSTSSSVNLPANTHSRRRSVRSSDPSRSWLHSMVVRSVWWRGSAARLPPVSSAEPVGQAIEDLLRREDPRPDRRELDRERQAVEPAAQVHDRRPVGGGQLERCPMLPTARSVKSWTDSFWRSWSRDSSAWARGSSSGGIGQHVLTRNRQRLAAGGDHPHAGRGLEDVGHEQRGRPEQVLAVVHDEQQLLVPQVREQEGPRLGRGLVAQVQGRQHGVADQRRDPEPRRAPPAMRHPGSRA